MSCSLDDTTFQSLNKSLRPQISKKSRVMISIKTLTNTNQRLRKTLAYKLLCMSHYQNQNSHKHKPTLYALRYRGLRLQSFIKNKHNKRNEKNGDNEKNEKNNNTVAYFYGIDKRSSVSFRSKHIN